MRAGSASLLLLLALAAPGCAPLITPLGVALTAGATGGTMAMQERGLGGGIEDNSIALSINDAWLKDDPAIFRKVSTSIHDGMVVLTGSVTYRETAKRAETIAAGVEGVRSVTNHIRVDREPGLGTAASDRWITTKLRAELTFASDVNAVNYAFDTIAGTVFISGVARDQAELDRVVSRVKRTGGVRDVVTAVRLRTEPLPPKHAARRSVAPSALPPASTTPASTTPGPTSHAPTSYAAAAPRAVGAAVTAEPLPPLR
ncbi:BON domain-containing protein [Elioraea sp.]|uniref:BON domain-containing protein n=1 Tax=Elioraea sp. TaxID=2185103 RepID=UPI0025BB11C6|nr:BON domain-containing protein [Elioraea sp.]